MDRDNSSVNSDKNDYIKEGEAKPYEEPRTAEVVVTRLPLGVSHVLRHLSPFKWHPKISYGALAWILTFLTYTHYHMTRKVFSVVKPALTYRNASEIYNENNCSINYEDCWTYPNYTFIVHDKDCCNCSNYTGWEPFNDDHSKTLLGSVDYSWSFAYAIFMFFSGIVADRVNLRYFLTFGLIGGGIGTCLMGVPSFAKIHHLYYFIIIQLLNGAIQSTGWPSVVAVMGNWFGKSRRGLIMGIWNAHTSFGNIFGALIPAYWTQPCVYWGLGFVFPGSMMILMGVMIFLFLVIDPTDVGLLSPKHHNESRMLNASPADSPNRNAHSDSPPRIIGSSPCRNHNGNTNEEAKPLLDDNNGEGEHRGNHKRNSSVSRYVINSSPYRVVVGGGEDGAIGFIGALMIPGVIEYSLSLFFAKLVAYTFLFWLPFYVKHSLKSISNVLAAYLSTLFDVGGIFGGVTAGLFSDWTGARAITCVLALFISVPALFVYQKYGNHVSYTIVLLLVSGFFVNAPYALITTAVSSDLGTHKSLRNSQKAKATVSAIIDGTGSIGAALGPLLTGWISEYGWKNVFYLLMASCFLSGVFLTRLVLAEICRFLKKYRYPNIDQHWFVVSFLRV